MRALVVVVSFISVLAAADCAVKHPVVLVPGIMGTVVDGRAVNMPKNDLPSYCPRNFDWKRLWIAIPDFLPGIFQCFEYYWGQVWNGKGWTNVPGVETRIPGSGFGDVYPVDSLDPSGLVKEFSHYFHDTIVALQSLGYVVNRDVVAAPYDWRETPNPEWAARTKALVENVTAANGGSPAVFVAHSMGAIWTYYFVMSQPTEWRMKHIHSIVAVSPAWMGSPMSLDSLFAGYSFNTPIDGSFFAPLTRKVPSELVLMPQPAAWPKDMVLAQTPSRNYTFAESLDILSAVGYEDAAAKYAYATAPLKPWKNSYSEFPGMPVHCIVSPGKPTTRTMVFSEDITPRKPGEKWPVPKLIKTDGDGTVPIESLRYPCDKWAAEGHSDVTVEELPKLGHVKILYSKAFTSAVQKYACSP